jgi:hypothetical protein
MLGVTVFGLLFTPVFYLLVRWIGTRNHTKQTMPAVPSPDLSPQADAGSRS